MKTINLIRVSLVSVLVIVAANAQWTQMGLSGRTVTDIAVGNGMVFAVTGDSGSVYRSTDGGVNWIQVVQSHAIDMVVAPTGTVFMLKQIRISSTLRDDTLFRSTDNGNLWSRPSVPDTELTSISVSVGGTIVGGTRWDGGRGGGWTGILISADDGLSWSDPGPCGGRAFAFREQNIISYGDVWGLFAIGHYMSYSPDEGQTWIERDCQGLGNGKIALSLCSNGDIIAATNTGIFLSTDSCDSWTETSTLVCEDGVSLPNAGMLVGAKDLGIVLLGDHADSLGLLNEGLTDLNVHTLTVDNSSYVYAGTDSGIWRRPLSEILASAYPLTNKLPNEFLLQQNFPNPFNPSTTIAYDLPREGRIRLAVYNTLGQQVALLVDDYLPAGHYRLKWSVSNLASGVYFYRLHASEFVQTKRMVLMK